VLSIRVRLPMLPLILRFTMPPPAPPDQLRAMVLLRIVIEPEL